jgi:cytochrome c553
MNASFRPRASAALACCIAGSAIAAPALIDLRDIGPVEGHPEAVRGQTAVCDACHGPEGIPAVPTFPSIAGQPAAYLYWQLVEFQREARAGSPMTPIVTPLTDQQLRDYAAWYAALPAPQPETAADDSAPADPALVERGGELFRHGDAVAGVPPCQGCHGIDASGHPLAASEVRYRTYPRLRGQHAPFLVQRLQAYRDGKHTLASTDRIMQGVAHNLDDAQIAALAAWLSAGATP